MSNNGAEHMWARDRAYDRRRTVGAPDTLPEMHENVARGADVMADQLESNAAQHEVEGNLLYGQASRRAAERHRQLASYHREQAEIRREHLAGHPSTWGSE